MITGKNTIWCDTGTPIFEPTTTNEKDTELLWSITHLNIHVWDFQLDEASLRCASYASRSEDLLLVCVDDDVPQLVFSYSNTMEHVRWANASSLNNASPPQNFL